MFGLALLAGYGENTWIHGVGDGAPWIAQQLAEVFPRQRYLLERYHLLEHLRLGATGLPGEHPEAAKAWVARQVECIEHGYRLAVQWGRCNPFLWCHQPLLEIATQPSSLTKDGGLWC